MAVVPERFKVGAVLLGKTAVGALAWGDVWFGGTTRNPWNTEQGSSGSSAGPGAAVAAGTRGEAVSAASVPEASAGAPVAGALCTAAVGAHIRTHDVI